MSETTVCPLPPSNAFLQADDGEMWTAVILGVYTLIYLEADL